MGHSTNASIIPMMCWRKYRRKTGLGSRPSIATLGSWNWPAALVCQTTLLKSTFSCSGGSLGWLGEADMADEYNWKVYLEYDEHLHTVGEMSAFMGSHGETGIQVILTGPQRFVRRVIDALTAAFETDEA
jgi:hypothetical protein